MNNVFATSSSVLSAKTLKRQSGRKVKLLETRKKIKIRKPGAGCCCAPHQGRHRGHCWGMRTSRPVGTNDVVLAFASHHAIPLPTFMLAFWKQVRFYCCRRQRGYNSQSCGQVSCMQPPLLLFCPTQPPPIISSANIIHLLDADIYSVEPVFFLQAVKLVHSRIKGKPEIK